MTVPVFLGFLSGSPGVGELLVVFAVILILFGPRRLPEIARMIGRTLHELRRASQDFRDQVMQIDVEDRGGSPVSSDSRPVPVVDIDTEEGIAPVDAIATDSPCDPDDEEEPKNDSAG